LTSWPRGYDKIQHEVLDSTNSEARRLAEKGEQGPVWISAEVISGGNVVNSMALNIDYRGKALGTLG